MEILRIHASAARDVHGMSYAGCNPLPGLARLCMKRLAEILTLISSLHAVLRVGKKGLYSIIIFKV